jgi:hypothetical protein
VYSKCCIEVFKGKGKLLTLLAWPLPCFDSLLRVTFFTTILFPSMSNSKNQESMSLNDCFVFTHLLTCERVSFVLPISVLEREPQIHLPPALSSHHPQPQSKPEVQLRRDFKGLASRCK